jgi:hypothetical protein
MRTVVLFLVLFNVRGSQCLVNFYPYGLPAEDEKVTKNDDGSSPDIPISTLFPFFNHQHDHLIVSIELFGRSFIVLRPAQEFFTDMEMSALPVKGCQI